MVFPVLHGSFGEDGRLQGLLEMIPIAYVGADLMGSALAMDKIIAKILWQKQGLPVVPYRTMESWNWENSQINKKFFWESCKEELGIPMFIKPSNAGSSVGVTRASDEIEFYQGIDKALKFDNRILIEKAIHAREIELAVLGNHEITVFPAGEISSSHSFYDYEAKYIDPKGASLYIPANLEDDQMKEAMDLALSAYKCINIKGLSRVDLFMDKNNMNFYINEINTLPGFTSISMFPMLCQSGGLNHSELMHRLIQLAMEHFSEQEQLKYFI
jgi:D-alanine-D-alanine ligase